MKTCNICKVEKSNDKFKKSGKSKDGLQNTCMACKKQQKRQANNLKYQKTTKLINPDNPIPLKLVGQDGFGGKWSYDLARLKEPLMLAFAQQYGYVLSKRKGIYQLKSKSEQQLKDFVVSIGMSDKSVYKIQRESDKQHLECYVVNLYGVRL